ncbi:hypothetical protein HQ529_05085 [Candidatus Woesearchaeota archaeon]|nr:hypothetical protein [Candidatus Woesearchaeota archaeon]
MFLPLAYAFILSLSHYYSERIKIKYEDFKYSLLSFSSGLAVSYLMLVLFPELYKGVTNLDRFIFLFVLVGFISLYLIDKYIYEFAEMDKVKDDLKVSHSIAFFIYHLFIGIVLVDFASKGAFSLTLFFIPVLLVTITTGVSFNELHYDVKENRYAKLFLSLSTLIGMFFAVTFNIPQILNLMLIGVVGGVMLFLVVREFIPHEKRADPLYFIYGLLLYTIFIIITWILNI